MLTSSHLKESCKQIRNVCSFNSACGCCHCSKKEAPLHMFPSELLNEMKPKSKNRTPPWKQLFKLMVKQLSPKLQMILIYTTNISCMHQDSHETWCIQIQSTYTQTKYCHLNNQTEYRLHSKNNRTLPHNKLHLIFFLYRPVSISITTSTKLFVIVSIA